MATLIDGAGALLLEDDNEMGRLLPDPHAPIGHRRDGRLIFPILGADPTDPSNDQLLDAGPSAQPAAPAEQLMDQEMLSRLLAREKQQGERTAVRKLTGVSPAWAARTAARRRRRVWSPAPGRRWSAA
ncbi:hypothetical protein [Streptomyces mirabilis]|uniref:hypothetical protein n=1 Tax=Streptomyces mirabilis TaxID=68239 RepID=UPI0036BE19B1